MSKIEIYVLTHKKVQKSFNKIYYPLFCGSSLANETYNYIRDDTGENISELNPYYAELTGEYWAWKHSEADIIGFCHYRRLFSKNIFMKELDEKDIEKRLDKHDIILPQKTNLNKSVFETIHESLNMNPDYGAKLEDYLLLKEIIKENFPSYLKSFEEVLDGKSCYNNNMFICNKKLANEYFNWLFAVLELMYNEIDFNKYDANNTRVLGFMSEILLTTFVKKNNLKISESYLHLTEWKVPQLFVLRRKFPFIDSLCVKVFTALYS